MPRTGLGADKSPAAATPQSKRKKGSSVYAIDIVDIMDRVDTQMDPPAPPKNPLSKRGAKVKPLPPEGVIAAQMRGYGASTKMIVEHLGCSRAAYDRWIQREDFRALVRETAARRVDLMYARALDRLERELSGSNDWLAHQAAVAIVGIYRDVHAVAGTSTAVQVVFNGLPDGPGAPAVEGAFVDDDA